MKKVICLSIAVSALVAVAVSWAVVNLPQYGSPLELVAVPTPVPTPLARYSIDSLSATTMPANDITIRETISTDDQGFTSYLFEHEFSPNMENTETKMVTGQANFPNTSGSYPLVLMLRGYVDQSIFTTGTGTRPAAGYFAKNGFITIAPDFLGYGGSSRESGNIYETRFQTYVTVMSILASIKERGLASETGARWDGENIFIWAHSNGGQIALTYLAISSAPVPTTLWAPVTKPFPYSVLYYTDQSADGGKFIRQELSKFEELYDVDLYSFTNYLDRIEAPLQLHQGGADSAIPVSWSDQFVARARNAGIEVDYFKYPSADHNLRPSWDTVVERDVEFFTSYLEN